MALVLKFIHLIPFPRLHEILRAAAPTERPRVPGVVVLDVALNRRDAGVQRVKDRVLEPLPHQLREEPLHGVHPRRRGRREVKRPVGMALQPLADLGRPVGRHVVKDDVHRGSGLDPLRDVVEEGEELRRGVPLDRPADDLPRGDVEGRQKAGGAVPPVVARSRLRMVRRHGQRRLRASQSLYLRLLVHREHYGVVWRIDMQARDIADPDLEPRVPGHLERLHLVRLEAVAAKNVANRCRVHAANLSGQRLESPVPGVPSPMIPGGDMARSTGAFTLSSSIGFFPGGRVASRRRPSTPSSRKRSHQRHTVGFDMPVRRIVSTSPCPEPSARTMRARQACF